MPAARRPLACVALLALAAAGCGSSSGRHGLVRDRAGPAATATAGPASAESGPVTAAEERVIRHWAASLRHGDVAEAARSFALPSIVENGTPPLKITTRAQAEAFQRALPCGATVLRLERRAHGFVVTTFRLTERPGPGTCGTGTGGLAQTAFRVRDGHITEWFRVPLPSEVAPSGTPS
jgi:hypothetical protein